MPRPKPQLPIDPGKIKVTDPIREITTNNPLMLAACDVAKPISALAPTPLKNNDSSATSKPLTDNKQLMLAAYNVAKSISALVPTPLKNNDSSVTSNHSVDNKQLMLAAYNVAKSISALVPTPLKDNGNSATSNLSADNKQEAASAIITNALNVVNHLMSSISLQLQNLQQASDDVNQSITCIG